MPTKRKGTQGRLSKGNTTKVNTRKKKICDEKSDFETVEIKEEYQDESDSISDEYTEQETNGRRKSRTAKGKLSSSRDRNLKFDAVVIKVNDKEVLKIPEYPDIQIKLVKGGKHPYMCSKCDAGFWTKGAYEAHIPVHILRKAKPPVKKFRCDICAKEFSKLCDVERHTRVHTGEKPCICNICNKRFQQAHNLSKHLLTHLHIKPFHCEICNKQFGRNDVLRRHLLTHSVDKPVKCSVCLRGFIRHSQLLQHMRRKHPETPIDDDLREQYGDDLREQYGDEEDLSLSDNREEPDDDEPSSSSVVAKRGTIKTEAQGSEQISF